MTAGSAATARVDADAHVHAVDPTLPFQSRRLSPSERSHRVLFSYYSPRNRRVVTVAHILHLAIALRFEFDPSLVAYVERPRRIALSPKQEIDISFWTRNRAGEERYFLAITNSGTMGSTSGTVSIRDQDMLDEAAARHTLQLSYITEREMTSAVAQCAIALELLPHVQAYTRLHSRSLIRERINAHLQNSPRTTLAQLLQLLDSPPDSVKAVVAGMIHGGSLKLVEYVAGNATVTVEVCRA